jgi:molybdopterin-binding protein
MTASQYCAGLSESPRFAGTLVTADAERVALGRGCVSGYNLRERAVDARRYGRGSGKMKLSARNMLKGTVTEVESGTVNCVVKVDIGGGKIISSMITLDACKDMDLKAGSEVYAIIKSSNVILGTL